MGSNSHFKAILSSLRICFPAIMLRRSFISFGSASLRFCHGEVYNCLYNCLYDYLAANLNFPHPDFFLLIKVKAE